MTDIQQQALVQEGLESILVPGQVVELRALGVPMANGLRTMTGFFDSPALMAEAAMYLDKQGARGVYFTPNPLRADIGGSERNSIGIARRGSAASDTDVATVNWLLVDIDTSRPANTSSSLDEKSSAASVAAAVRTYLEEKGWPSPLFADSANGYHLMYRCDGLTPELHKRVLDFLAFRFNRDHQAIVDQFAQGHEQRRPAMALLSYYL